MTHQQAQPSYVEDGGGEHGDTELVFSQAADEGKGDEPEQEAAHVADRQSGGGVPQASRLSTQRAPAARPDLGQPHLLLGQRRAEGDGHGHAAAVHDAAHRR